MPSDSTAIQARTVFKQDTAPVNTDALWIDTSKNGNPLKRYDEKKRTGEKVANSLERIMKATLIHSDGFAPGFAG